MCNAISNYAGLPATRARQNEYWPVGGFDRLTLLRIELGEKRQERKWLQTAIFRFYRTCSGARIQIASAALRLIEVRNALPISGTTCSYSLPVVHRPTSPRSCYELRIRSLNPSFRRAFMKAVPIAFASCLLLATLSVCQELSSAQEPDSNQNVVAA